jgi:hypothetical protein
MVSTENSFQEFSDRARIKAFLGRVDVIAQLQSYGISSDEAIARVDSLTDQEVAGITNKLDELPAGGGWVTIPVTAFLIAFVVVGIIVIALDKLTPLKLGWYF